MYNYTPWLLQEIVENGLPDLCFHYRGSICLLAGTTGSFKQEGSSLD
jgi:hypothetical protein